MTIQNPDRANACNITLQYLLSSSTLNPISLTIQPGTRGTIIPKNLNARAAAWVHSDQPVVVERPTYFNDFSYGNAQNVSGSATVVGAPAPANDWRFAEGYIGGQFQENLVLANFGPTTANATVVLAYDNGSTLTNTYPIRAEGSITLDVKCSSTSTILTGISTRRPQQWVAPM